MALTKVQTIGIETGISLTGVTTVTTLNASTDTLSVGGTVNFGGNVSIAGTLTYEDVTNIDSVGIITARSGINVTGGDVGIGLTNPEDYGNFADDLVIYDSSQPGMTFATGTSGYGSIYFADGTAGNAASRGQIQYGHSDDYMAFATAASEALRIDSSGRLLLGTTTEGDVNADNLTIVDSGNCGMTIRSGTSSSGGIFFSDGTSGDAEYRGQVYYDHNGDYMRFSTAASEAMRIDSSGRLAIATTVQGESSADNLTLADSGNCGLTIRSGTSNGGSIYFSDATSGAAQYDGYISYNHPNQFLVFGTGSSERMRIDSSGNMGLGETSADTRLHIKESTTGATGIFIQNSNGATNSSADLYFGNWNGSSTTTPQARIQAINKNVNTAATDLAFWTYSGSSTIERMRIDSDGDIHHTGATSSGGSNKLARYLVPSHSGTEEDVCVFQFENESSLNQITIGGGTASYNSATNIVFRTSSAVDTTTGEYRARIDSNGDFLVQTTSNTEYTRTSGAGSWGYTADTGTNRGSIIHANNADNGWSMMYMNKYNWTDGDDGRYINFYKNGSSLSSIMLNSSGTIAYNTGSDYRLKENIVPMTNGITRIKQLMPKQFNMIDDPDNNLCDGFLAHEAQTVVPQAVWGTHNGMKTDEEGNEVPDYQGMDYGKLTPLLTAALQEAIAKIETLEAKVAALEG